MMTMVGAARQVWMLEGLVPDAAGHHQPAMNVGCHLVGAGQFIQGLRNTVPVHADIDIHGLAGLEQAVHVLFKKRPFSVVKAHAFPHAVTQHEAGIVDRYLCRVPVHQIAVDVNFDIPVARILFGGMCRMSSIDHGIQNLSGTA